MEDPKLLLLGPPQVEVDSQSTAIRLRKAGALLAYLAVERRAFSRDHLAALLWPDLSHERAHSNLRRTLTGLRGLLANGCIVVDGDLVQLQHVDVDLDQFRLLLSAPQIDHDPIKLEQAVALYRGDFLEGFNLGDCEVFDEWQDSVRRMLRASLETSLEELCEILIGNGDLQAALPYAVRWLDLDHLNERAHRALMTIYTRLGRTSAARRQYESCIAYLRGEGLEPDEETTHLFENLVERNGEAVASASSESHQPQGVGHRVAGGAKRKRRVIGLAVAVAAALLGSTVPILQRFVLDADIVVASLEPALDGDRLRGLGIGFNTRLHGRCKARFSVMFSADASIGLNRNYLVYADEIIVRADSGSGVFLDARTDLFYYVESNSIAIPPGWYTASVMADPLPARREAAPADNNLTSRVRFFFPGLSNELSVEFHLDYTGTESLNLSHPIRVFLGQPGLGPEHWAGFPFTSTGRYYLPLNEIPEDFRNHDRPFFLLMIHDAGNDLTHPLEPGPGDVTVLYREGPGNLIHGTFPVWAGTDVLPGGVYQVEFAAGAPPGADGFEPDDSLESAREVELSPSPVVEMHSFHDEGDGTDDWDWYTVVLRAGDSMSVETRSAGNGWESNTLIDVNDSVLGYLHRGEGSPSESLYDRLEYANETGRDQRLYLCIHPRNRPDMVVNHTSGEYIVEFRLR